MTDLGKDLDAIIEQANEKSACRVQGLISEIRADHGDDIADKFANLIGDTAYSVNALIQTIRSHGYKLGKDAVARHRKRGLNGGCDCA